MRTPLSVGILGFGYTGATFHAPLISAVPGLRLSAIASGNAAKVHAAWPDVAVCASPQALIARPDIDLVVLATPNATHHPLAAEALEAGKHVVVDKPFTLNVSCCRSLYFTGRVPNYFARNARGFPALITSVAQCRQVDECEEPEEREAGVRSASRRCST
ncbi:Gfo/Idh/MocA family oxidoreductase, partial [Thiocapsa sp.]|uniref:Gfo/Idh/MocA family oxidoreductase n=1 Tax=Thiocapsa sp. TaxID=2024551 RepID=UPI002B66CF0B